MENEEEELEIRRGQQANILLSDPLLKEALISIEERYTQVIRHALSAADIWDAKYMLIAMDNFNRCLTSYVETGTFAEVGKSQREELMESDPRLNA